MPRLHKLHIAILLMVSLTASACAINQSHEELSLPELQQRLESIDKELQQLARCSLRGGTGPIGFNSRPGNNSNEGEWIRIELEGEFLIDQIVLAPSIRRSPNAGLQAEAFPIAFRILAGTSHTKQVVATYTEEDHLLPRIAPLVVNFPPIYASWVMVEATVLSPRHWNNKAALHLSEIMVFSGMDNVALHKPVSASSTSRIRGRHERYVVDGFVPYLMESNLGNQTRCHTLNTSDPNLQPVYIIDLDETLPINQINLHMGNSSDQVIPNPAPSDMMAPAHLRVTGANQQDFSDETTLFEYQPSSVYDVGPIIIRRFPETQCRYIRVHIIKLQPSVFNRVKFAVNFDEIEILSEGHNVALGKAVDITANLEPITHPKRITDGNNFFGQILPIRTWMSQLALRHDLETERPLIIAELNLHNERHRTNLNRMYWVVTLLIAGTVIGILIELIIRQKATLKLRKRLAADLHDEFGGNLHAIGLLGDTAKKIVTQKHATKEWSDLLEIVTDIRDLTEETGSTVRSYSTMLEANPTSSDISKEMKSISARVLNDLNHEFSVTGQDLLYRLDPSRRIGLVLFYKESLTNIIRHSNATAVSSKMAVGHTSIRLMITDNGRGTQGTIPRSLKRRARLLHARLTVENPTSGGTTILLQLRLQSYFYRMIPDLFNR